MIPAFKQVQTNDRVQNQIQDNVQFALVPIQQCPVIDGILLQNIDLINGTNIIDHKLGRKLIGWFLVRINNSIISLYDTQDTNPNPEQTLNLVINGNAQVSIYVF